MNKLRAGFGRADITPDNGVDMIGYIFERKTSGVLDPIEANAVIFECDARRAIILTVDTEGIHELSDVRELQQAVADAIDTTCDAVFISCTHAHTGATIDSKNFSDAERRYFSQVRSGLINAAKAALADLTEAAVSVAEGKAEGIAFVRRYRMKDGSVATNPGIHNPDILHPLGKPDERVHLVRIDRKDKDSIAIINFACHPDTVGEDLASADFPGFARRIVERDIPDTKCIFINGAQGDVNHLNPFIAEEDLLKMRPDFDGPRSYSHAEYMGSVIANAVKAIYANTEPTGRGDVRFMQKTVDVPSNMPSAEEIPEAKLLWSLHEAGRDAEIPYQGMALTTKVFGARRKLKLEHGPESFPVRISVITAGGIAFVGLQGEPFAGIGMALKENLTEYSAVIPACITNGHIGYFPMTEAYDEGGYEVESSDFKRGISDIIINESIDLVRKCENGK